MHSLHSRIERTVDALKEAYILALQLIHPSREYLYDRELTSLLHVLSEASGVDAQTIQDFCEGEAKRRRDCASYWAGATVRIEETSGHSEHLYRSVSE